jgi:hypothetical protein
MFSTSLMLLGTLTVNPSFSRTCTDRAGVHASGPSVNVSKTSTASTLSAQLQRYAPHERVFSMPFLPSRNTINLQFVTTMAP